MAHVVAGENESIDSLVKRFSRQVQHEGILSAYKRRRYYSKPSVKRKKKLAAKRRKSARNS